MREESDTKRKILTAARQVFVQKGRDGARMQEIADYAGVNKALLHYYYNNKENLYLEVIIGAFGQFLGNMEEIFNSPRNFEEQLQEFVNHHIDFISKNPDILKLIVPELLRENSTIINGLAELISVRYNFPQRIFQVFQKAIENNEIREHNPWQTFISILSMNIMYFVISPFAKLINPTAIGDEAKFIEERKQAIIDLVLRGIQQQSNQ